MSKAIISDLCFKRESIDPQYDNIPTHSKSGYRLPPTRRTYINSRVFTVIILMFAVVCSVTHSFSAAAGAKIATNTPQPTLERYAEAEIDKLSEVIRLNPNNATAYYDRGNAYFDNGDLDDAVEDYTEAIRLDPNLIEAYYNRGLAHYMTGKMDQAAYDFDTVIDAGASFTDAYYVRALARFNMNNPQGAVEDFSEFLRIYPNNGGVYSDRAYARYYAGDYSGAADDCKTFTKLDSDSNTAYFNCGYIYYLLTIYPANPETRIKELQQAVQHLRKAQALGYDFGEKGLNLIKDIEAELEQAP